MDVEQREDFFTRLENAERTDTADDAQRRAFALAYGEHH